MVTFANGKTIETIAVYGGTTQFQDARRETLEIRAAHDKTSFEELKALYTDSAALSEITVVYEYTATEIVDGENKEVVKKGINVQLNYTLPVELSLKDIDGEQTWCMKLAQKSALEIEQESQAAAINDTQLALIELAGMMGGG